MRARREGRAEEGVGKTGLLSPRAAELEVKGPFKVEEAVCKGGHRKNRTQWGLSLTIHIYPLSCALGLGHLYLSVH